MAKFTQSKLYYFHYRPLHAAKLSFWDKQPLMFPLRVGPSHTLGINIHWIHPKMRKAFLEFLLQLSQKVRNPKRFARMTYDVMKADVRLRHSLPGIRLYINNKASNVKEITREEAADFFDPLKMQRALFRKHRAKKVFYPKRGRARN